MTTEILNIRDNLRYFIGLTSKRLNRIISKINLGYQEMSKIIEACHIFLLNSINSGAAAGSRITKNEFLALFITHQSGQTSGVDVIQQSEGIIKPGSAHFILRQLESKGLLISTTEPKKPDGTGGKRLYTLTKKGLHALNTNTIITQGVSNATL